MVVLDERGEINAAGIVIYILLLVLLAIIFKRNRFRGMLGLYYVVLFTVVKTIGGAMTVYVQSTLDMRLYTPAAIIGTVVLSPLMLALCALLMPDKITRNNFRSFRASMAPNLIFATRAVILTALCVGITGGLFIFTTNTTPLRIARGQILLRTAAGLAISSWILTMSAIILFYPERHTIGIAYPIITTMTMPAFLVRLAYGCGVASTFQTNLTQIFNPLIGNWIIYLFMAFLPEVFITGSLVGIGLVSSYEYK